MWGNFIETTARGNSRALEHVVSLAMRLTECTEELRGWVRTLAMTWEGEGEQARHRDKQ